MSRFLARSVTAVLTAGGALAVIAAPASAHEPRTGGPVRIVVGWGDEPTYTGFKNSVQVTITDANGAPVTDIGDTLRVEVIKGADRMTLPLVANFGAGAAGTPGEYRAWVTPTRPGSYTFRLTGNLRGQSLDESFTSSRTTFNEVEDVAGIAFPAKDPSAGQLATRIDREVPRLKAALGRAEDRADKAWTLALASVLVGAVGLLAGGSALVVARRGARRESKQTVSEMARSTA